MAALAVAFAIVLMGAGAAPAAARFNVLLVIMDTTRADHVPGFGGAPARAPWLASLPGVRFLDARSQAPTTTSAVASIFTGLYPSEHGVVDGGGPMPPTVPTLAQLLKAAGYLTGHVTGNPNSGPLYGLTRGFSSAEYSLPGDGSALLHQQLQHASAIARLADVFLLRQSRPFFLSLHFNDPHSPYDPAEWRPVRLPAGARRVYDTPGSDPSVGEVSAAERGDMLRRYDAEIGNVDRALAAVARRLQSAGEWDRTIVVITADHGEEFGEHGGWGHSHTLYPELLHVPLIVRVPGIAPRLVSTPVQHVDVLPTILALCGISPPAGLPGISRVPEISGQRPTEAPFRRAEKLDTMRSPRLFSVTQGRWTLINGERAQTPELFDTVRDPSARHNRAAEQPAVVAQLQALIERRPRLVSADQPAASIDADTLRNLRALGYLQGAAKVAAQPVSLDGAAAALSRTLLGGLGTFPGRSLVGLSSDIVSEESPRRVHVDVDMPAAPSPAPSPQRLRLRLAAGASAVVVSGASLIAADGARQPVTLHGQRTFRVPAGAVIEADPVTLAVARSWRVSLDADPLSLVRITNVDSGLRTTLTLSDPGSAPVTFAGAVGVIGWTPDRDER